MKTHRILLLTALLALPGLLPAQTSGVPEFISYQGRVLDSAGAAVGTGTPVNRTVIFRVWDHPSNTLAANLIYSEQQTVTIADGKFSVLVGQGVATTGTQFTYSETSKGLPTVNIANAFNGSGRYLGVTVDDGTAAVDNEIAPRQQVVSSAFAFRSKFAETINGGTITGTIAATGSTFTGGTLTGGTFTGGTFSGTGSNLTNLNATSLSSGTVNDARLSTNVALLARSPQTFTGATNSFNGSVGIGTTAPQTKLHVVEGDLTVSAGSNVPNAGGSINFGNAQLQSYSPMSKVQGVLESAPGTELQGGLGFFTRPYNAGAVGQSLTEKVRITSTGNVGIGTTFPGTKLDVNGVVRAFAANPSFSLGDSAAVQRGALGVATNVGAFSTDAIANDVVLRTEGGKLLLQSGSGASAIAIATNNNVGIGTSTPTKAKLVVNGGSQTTVTTPNYFIAPEGAGQNNGPFAWALSIYADNNVGALRFFAFSDARIKQIEGRSDAAQDLATILGIQVTDYTYIDKIGKGAGKQKKVIAQQVEAVFPQAVSKATDVVPDIYQKATQQDDWVQLATDLKVGDRVKLMGEKEEGIHEVLEVKAGAFRTAFKPATDKVFVYGREVKDFRSVDYEALSMLNVSATQELARQLEQQKAENAELKARLAEQAKDLATLKVKDEARDTKLAAIEAMLSASPPATRTASLKQGAGRVE